MSYEIVSSIRLDREKNAVMITGATNNIRPLVFETREYAPEFEWREKISHLLGDTATGTFQPRKNCKAFIHAFAKAEEALKATGEMPLIEAYSCTANVVHYHIEGKRPHWMWQDATISAEEALTSDFIKAGSYYLMKSEVEKAKGKAQKAFDVAVDAFCAAFFSKEGAKEYILTYKGEPIYKNGKYFYYIRDIRPEHLLSEKEAVAKSYGTRFGYVKYTKGDEQ